MNIKHKVVPVWMICYDGDASKIYSFTNFDKAVASIERSVRGYYFDREGADFDEICKQVSNTIYEHKDSPCIPMKFNNLTIVLYNWEIDMTNPIHMTLLECHKYVPSGLKKKIENLFADPVR